MTKINIYGYDKYFVRIVNPKIFASNYRNSDTYGFLDNWYRSQWIIPLPPTVKVDLKNKRWDDSSTFSTEEFLSDNLKNSDSLYINADCTIPRSKVFPKFKKATRKDKADTIVFPNISLVEHAIYCALFIQHNTEQIFLVPVGGVRDSSGIVQRIMPLADIDIKLGTKPADIDPELNTFNPEETKYSHYNRTNWDSFLNSEFLFKGFCACKDKPFLGDIFSDTTHNKISESTLLKHLSSDDNSLSKDSCNQIKSMLESSDPDTVNLGLMTLAELDYNKYKCSAMHLLKSTSMNWSKAKARNTGSVKFMLKQLNMQSYYSKYPQFIEKEDFDIMKGLLVGSIDKETQRLKNNLANTYPFLNLSIQIDCKYEPKLLNN